MAGAKVQSLGRLSKKGGGKLGFAGGIWGYGEEKDGTRSRITTWSGEEN